MDFLVPQTHIKKMMSNSSSFWKIECFILARVISLNAQLWNRLALNVTSMPMPSCSISILISFCGRNVVCHGQKYHIATTCFAKSYINSNSVCYFWFVDVPQWCGYFCFGYQFFESHLGPHAYHYGVIWNE